MTGHAAPNGQLLQQPTHCPAKAIGRFARRTKTIAREVRRTIQTTGRPRRCSSSSICRTKRGGEILRFSRLLQFVAA